MSKTSVIYELTDATANATITRTDGTTVTVQAEDWPELSTTVAHIVQAEFARVGENVNRLSL